MSISAHSIHCLSTADAQTRAVAVEVLRGLRHIRPIDTFARAMLAGLRRRSIGTDLRVLARQTHAKGQPSTDRTHRFRSRATRERRTASRSDQLLFENTTQDSSGSRMNANNLEATTATLSFSLRIIVNRPYTFHQRRPRSIAGWTP